MSGVVESLAPIGIYGRSDDRTSSTLVDQPGWSDYRDLLEASKGSKSTRLQMKYWGQEPSTNSILRPFVEGVLRPSLGDSIAGVVFLGANRTASRPETNLRSEWDCVREYWRKPLVKTPQERIDEVMSQGFSLGTYVTASDIADLAQIWAPFGWTEEGVSTFVNNYSKSPNQEYGWFCGVRNSEGRLRAAAKAEGLHIGGMNIIESTEWGTHPTARRLGLGTAAAIGLNVAILQSPPDIPFCIFAEANMAPTLPGHKVARDAGFLAPSADFKSPQPNGVLRSHVSVDGERRHFLMTQIAPEGIQSHYPKEFVNRVFTNFQ